MQCLYGGTARWRIARRCSGCLGAATTTNYSEPIYATAASAARLLCSTDELQTAAGAKQKVIKFCCAGWRRLAIRATTSFPARTNNLYSSFMRAGISGRLAINWRAVGTACWVARRRPRALQSSAQALRVKPPARRHSLGCRVQFFLDIKKNRRRPQPSPGAVSEKRAGQQIQARSKACRVTGR